MNTSLLLTIVSFAAISAHAASDSTTTLSELRTNGAFGFPQCEAKVLCDGPALRLSVWNNEEHLFAQAVLWTDDDASLGRTDDNREIGDWSSCLLDLDADGKETPDLDRNYVLNPWPGMEGLHYSVSMGEGSTTGLQKDSKGRGAIRYVRTPDGRRIRVDTFLIPMEEITRPAGAHIRLCYWGRSPKPALTVNSTGHKSDKETYYAHSIARASYHNYILAKGRELDIGPVPEGRNDISLSNRKNAPMPEVGAAAPEISAREWIQLKEAPTLAGLRGKVVVLEFWATWCGPCVAGIPQLNKLQEQYAGRKFQLLTFVEEGHKTMDKFLAKHRVTYPIGLESGALDAYGITGIPHAFVIDSQGKISWHGHTASPELEAAIAAALKETK